MIFQILKQAFQYCKGLVKIIAIMFRILLIYCEWWANVSHQKVLLKDQKDQIHQRNQKDQKREGERKLPPQLLKVHIMITNTMNQMMFQKKVDTHASLMKKLKIIWRAVPSLMIFTKPCQKICSVSSKFFLQMCFSFTLWTTVNLPWYPYYVKQNSLGRCVSFSHKHVGLLLEALLSYLGKE